MPNTIQSIYTLGQSVWYDNISRGMLNSGGLKDLIDIGVTGLTANPTIFEKAISNSNDYDDQLFRMALDGKDRNEIYDGLVIRDIQEAADLLRPVYDKTYGIDGYASLEVSPRLAYDTNGTISEAVDYFASLNRPNVMIKVPATPEGIPAIRALIGQGINVNVTLIFSVEVYKKVQQAYLLGLEDLTQTTEDLSRVASVASFFVSRVDTAVDDLLSAQIATGNGITQELLGKAAVSNAKIAYHEFQKTFGSSQFKSLEEKGAMVQRPLWASTGTKNPGYSDVLYVDSLIGKHTVNTMPDATLEAFLDHGNATTAVNTDLDQAEQAIEAIINAGISLTSITDKLLSDGVKAFADSFELLLDNIEGKRAQLLKSQPGVANTG
ncbi:MAG: transaldolase [SAR202 cluster bacterium]|jgi:transaldolase|nr:transaldolase [Chloroflexota bacterium]MQG80272.1 transaldolase [SAR202 cluster bacterium]